MYKVSISNASHSNFDETNVIARNHISRCKKINNISINYGILLYGGEYEVVGLATEFNDRYEYYGAGPEVNIAKLIPLPFNKFTTGVGFYFGAIHEIGSYADFMMESDESGLVDNNIQPFYLLTGSYVLLNYDFSMSHNAYFQASFNFHNPSIAVINNYKNTTFSISWSEFMKKSRNIGLYKEGMFTIGLGYNF